MFSEKSSFMETALKVARSQNPNDSEELIKKKAEEMFEQFKAANERTVARAKEEERRRAKREAEAKAQNARAKEWYKLFIFFSPKNTN